MKLCERIKELRKEKKITQSELGEKLGVRHNAIANYESGRNEPNVEKLIKMANVFEVSLDYLLCRTDERGE